MKPTIRDEAINHLQQAIALLLTGHLFEAADTMIRAESAIRGELIREDLERSLVDAEG